MDRLSTSNRAARLARPDGCPALPCRWRQDVFLARGLSCRRIRLSPSGASASNRGRTAPTRDKAPFTTAEPLVRRHTSLATGGVNRPPVVAHQGDVPHFVVGHPGDRDSGGQQGPSRPWSNADRIALSSPRRSALVRRPTGSVRGAARIPQLRRRRARVRYPPSRHAAGRAAARFGRQAVRARRPQTRRPNA
jgi:hypothetical protein